MLNALFLNCTLKSDTETSNTEALMKESVKILSSLNVTTEMTRIKDHHIPAAVEINTGPSDEWPAIYDKIKAADIVVIGTPLWLGEKSSICTKVIERLYAASSEKNHKGQAIYYNKVGGVMITGNEDGAKHASSEILYALHHIGFTIPPNVDAYWVGEAGPGPSYIEAGQNNSFTKSAVKTLSYNLYHLATMLKNTPIPAEGNTLE